MLDRWPACDIIHQRLSHRRDRRADPANDIPNPTGGIAGILLQFTAIRCRFCIGANAYWAQKHPDLTSLAAVRKEKGPHTTIVQCLCGWGNQHDPRYVVGDPKYADVGFYGFAAADPATTLPLHGTTGSPRDISDARNIEILRQVFHHQAPK